MPVAQGGWYDRPGQAQQLAARLPVLDDTHAPAAIELVWEECRRTTEAQERRVTQLDGKTTPLLAFGLALIVLLRAPTVGLSSELTDGLTGSLAIGLLATLSAVLPREWARVPDLKAFIEDANYRPALLRQRYLSNYLGAVANNERVLRVKIRWYKLAVISYILTLLVTAVCTLWRHG